MSACVASPGLVLSIYVWALCWRSSHTWRKHTSPQPNEAHSRERAITQELVFQKSEAAIDVASSEVARLAKAAGSDEGAGGVKKTDERNRTDIAENLSQQLELLQSSIDEAVAEEAVNFSVAWDLPPAQASLQAAASRLSCSDGENLHTLWGCDHRGHSNLRSDHPDVEPHQVLDDAIAEICARDQVRDQLETKLDCRSTESYLRFADPESGWIDEAYVTYLGGASNSNYVQATHNLIRSVHFFSDRPIVLVVIGYTYILPATWKRFPNLIVYRMDTLLTGLRFNFNKDRAILGARVKTGIQLDGDQIVASPRMNRMFEATRRYCTAQYPFPIPPVHWMSREGGPDANELDNTYAFTSHKYGYGGARSMRWVHAHPTYTYHALPFFHDVLLAKYTAAHPGRHHLGGGVARVWDLRADDPTMYLPALLRTGVDGRVERQCVSKRWMYSDEPMLNVHLWKANATRHWCKMDLEPGLYTTQSIPRRFYWDRKWYPDGIPLMFYSAHNTKRFPETLVLLAFLKACEQSAESTGGSCEQFDHAVCSLTSPQEMHEAMERDAEGFTSAACCCLSPRLNLPIFWKQHYYNESAQLPEQTRGAAKGDQMCLGA